ncbi:MAG: DnaA family protein [Pseudohongiellaceae bacterium]|jgi:DnaA family protein
MLTPGQLTLAVELNDEARFENYFSGVGNQQIINRLSSLASAKGDNFVYLWGAAFAGKSHLLQAVCHHAELENNAALYVSLKDASALAPEIFEGCDLLSVVCIDDLHCIVGQPAWEQALFILFNQLKESGTALIISAGVSAKGLDLNLRDLQSRLQSMLVFNLINLDDTDKKRALQHRAKQRGFELSDAVADYIIVRAGRGFDDLMRVLDKLDTTSLVQQRKLTVPLVKSALNW